MFNKIQTVYHTIRHLRLVQILYQVKYRLVKPATLGVYSRGYEGTRPVSMPWNMYLPTDRCWHGERKFTFLNHSHEFGDEVNWNYQGFGKLWNYNLQYANYLSLDGISDESKIVLMRSQYRWLSDGRLPLEPYPASLRTINMIRWISANAINDTELNGYLYAELNFLSKRLEYHLLGNHLLENAFALMMGGAFFRENKWIATAQRLLREELDEQILDDGAHFELSPMYHQIMFFRLLELIDWYSTWIDKDGYFETFLREKASSMYSWLKNISFRNGDIPHFNDSTNGISYSTDWLMQYANQLGIVAKNLGLSASGYRSVTHGDYELKIDFAQIGPSYQPGHAHADALSFILYYNAKPFLVEQGTSTYQIGPRRNLERSTEAHNTVVVDGKNQSEVWGGFRVARRARTTLLRDGEGGIYEGKHDGYRRLGIEHYRTFEVKKEYIKICDRLTADRNAKSFWHLHPQIEIKIVRDNSVTCSNGTLIVFEGATNIAIEDYQYAEQYNTYLAAKRIVTSFRGVLTTTINFGEAG